MKQDINKSAENKFVFDNFVSLVIIFFGLFVFNLSIPVNHIQRNDTKSSVLSETDSSVNELTFYYDSSGQRIAKINPLGENVYYVGPNLEIVILPDGTHYWRKNYYFNGKLIAVRTSLNESGEIVPIPTSTMTPIPTLTITTPTPTPTLTSTPVLQSCTDYGGYCIRSTTNCTGTIKRDICGNTNYVCCIPSNMY